MAADVLFDPYSPTNRREITVESWTDLAYDASGEVVNVYGRRDPVVVTDVRPLPGGSLVLVTLDAAERQWLEALLATGRVIGYEPGDVKFGLPSPCYLYVGKVAQVRVVKRATAVERRWTLDVQIATSPAVGTLSNSYQIMHPNGDDVLVQAWDAGLGRWQTVWYDSGWRDVGGLLLNGWTGYAHLRRTIDTVDLSLSVTSAPGGAAYGVSVLDLPAGFRPHDGIWLGAGRNGSTGAQPLLDVATYGTYPVRFLGDAGGGQVHSASLRAGSGAPIPTSLPGTLVSQAPTLLPAPPPVELSQ